MSEPMSLSGQEQAAEALSRSYQKKPSTFRHWDMEREGKGGSDGSPNAFTQKICRSEALSCWSPRSWNEAAGEFSGCHGQLEGFFITTEPFSHTFASCCYRYGFSVARCEGSQIESEGQKICVKLEAKLMLKFKIHIRSHSSRTSKRWDSSCIVCSTLPLFWCQLW